MSSAQQFARAQALATTKGSTVLAKFTAQREADRAVAAARNRPLPTRGARGPFTAATHDRLTASWLAGSRAINDELRSDLDALRARARDLAKNNDYARKFFRMVSRNVVGPAGFTLQARVQDGPKKPDSLANAAIELAFFKWAKKGCAEITGRMSFADACRATIVAVARDGEALVRLVRGEQARNAECFAVQLLDIARLDTHRNQERTSGSNAIVMGVEMDEFQRPLGYWLKDRADGSSSSSTLLPAADVLHIFLPEMAEQARGVPWMHAAMLAMHDLGEFTRSALLAARKGADTLGFIVSPDGTAPDMGGGQDGDAEIQLTAPGTFDVLPEGYDMKAFDSKYPNEVFDPFTKAILRRISSGLDVAYNSLANDLEGVNYSSIRAGVLEERDQWGTLQNWFIDALLEPIYAEWFPRAMLAGAITMPNGSALPLAKQEKFSAHEWQGRRWSWVDPMKDIEAARLEIKTGIASPQMVAARNGVDVEDVIDSIAAFESMVAKAKVTLIDFTNGGSTPSGTPANADAGQDDPLEQ